MRIKRSRTVCQNKRKRYLCGFEAFVNEVFVEEASVDEASADEASVDAV